MAFKGLDIPPYWRIVAPGVDPLERGPLARMTLLRIQDGPGFGVGTHETTQLCLLALGYFLRSGQRPRTMLDFGSGCGILAIAAALSGVQVQAVELDKRALSHARANAALNNVQQLIEFREQLSKPAPVFDWVFANILCKVLLEYADPLCARQSGTGRMVLSGLFGTDVPEILAHYRPQLDLMTHQIYERGDWRAVVFAPGEPSTAN